MNDRGWIHANSLIAAAMELARTPETMYDHETQEIVCREHGIFMEYMTNDELEMFNRLIDSF